MSEQTNPYRIVRMKQLASTPEKEGLIPVSASTIWRWISEGTFPKGHRFGPKTTAWYEAEVISWLEERRRREQ